MFYVVDVETSGLTPWTGELLTVAIVNVTIDGELTGDEFYERLRYRGTTDPRTIPPHERTLTEQFWSEQNDFVIHEAFNVQPRFSMPDVARHVRDFVIATCPDNQSANIAANPSYFDKMWMEFMFAHSGVESPFHYRTLCLRSMRFGIEEEDTLFGSQKGAQKSAIEHHALEDAKAEAIDLQELIRVKANRFDHFTRSPSS